MFCIQYWKRIYSHHFFLSFFLSFFSFFLSFCPCLSFFLSFLHKFFRIQYSDGIYFFLSFFLFFFLSFFLSNLTYLLKMQYKKEICCICLSFLFFISRILFSFFLCFFFIHIFFVILNLFSSKHKKDNHSYFVLFFVIIKKFVLLIVIWISFWRKGRCIEHSVRLNSLVMKREVAMSILWWRRVKNIDFETPYSFKNNFLHFYSSLFIKHIVINVYSRFMNPKLMLCGYL